MVILRDRVKETTTALGVLSVVPLFGAMTGFQAFYTPGALDIGDAFHCVIEHANTGLGEWQVCLGTLTAANEVTVSTVYDSSNGGAAVAFSSGLKYIWLDFDASLASLALAPVNFTDLVGSASVSQIPDLPASKIASGTFDAARIPDLSATYSTPTSVNTAIASALTPYSTSAQIAATYATPASVTSQIAGATIATSQLIGNLDYSRISGTGPFADQYIPNLNASKINAGTFDNARINWASPSAIGTGTPANITGLAIAGTSGTFTGALISDTPTFVVDAVNHRVGVGLTNPTGKFHVYDSVGSSEMYVIGSVNGYPRLYMGGSDASIAGVFNRVKPGAAIYFGENTDTGGTLFRGTGGLTISGTNTSARTAMLIQNTATNATTNYARLGLGPHSGYTLTSLAPYIEGYNAANNAGLAFGTYESGQAERMRILPSGYVGINTTNPLSRLHVIEVDTAAASVTNALTIGRHSTGAGVAGYGSAILTTLKSSTTADRSASIIETVWNVATDAGAIADLVLSAYRNAGGTLTKREGFRVRGGASATEWAIAGGTVGATATVTGSRGGNAALADLITKLAAKGIIIDGTSA